MRAAEHGLPLLGVALQSIDPANDWEPMFEKHGSDAVWLNMGPGGGWVLALRTLEAATECSITKSQAMFTKWPRALACPPSAHACLPGGGARPGVGVRLRRPQVSPCCVYVHKPPHTSPTHLKCDLPRSMQCTLDLFVAILVV